jgi:predicted nucleic acid-binding protein
LRTALDTNVLSALWSGEPSSEEIEEALFDARNDGGLVICAPVYCELIAHPSASRDFVHEFLADTSIVVDFALDEQIWQRTASAFALYAQRRRKSRAGSPKRMLVDFLIASHALLRADRLMTLEKNRYERDFPKLRLM